MEDREQLACRSIEGYGRPDWQQTLRALVAPEIVYEETGTGRRVEGVDAVFEVLAAWQAAFGDIRGEVRRVVAHGDSTAVEIVWTGTHTGPLATAAGTVPASGARVVTHATMWQRWDGDRIVHEHHHVDVLSLLRQVGALPAPAVSP